MARAQPQAREKQRGGPGRLATFAVLSCLIVAGLVLGIVAGVVWEDPGLVLAYLSGETEDVAWSAPAAKPPAPEVALAPAERERPVDPQVRRKQPAVTEKVPEHRLSTPIRRS